MSPDLVDCVGDLPKTSRWSSAFGSRLILGLIAACAAMSASLSVVMDKRGFFAVDIDAACVAHGVLFDVVMDVVLLTDCGDSVGHGDGGAWGSGGRCCCVSLVKMVV